MLRRVLAGLLFCGVAHAGVVQDQAVIAVSGSAPPLELGGLSEGKYAQTFQAGISGELSHVSMVVSCQPDSPGVVTVEIQGVAPAGLPDGTVLGASSVPASGLFVDPPWFQDFAIPGVTLTAGAAYAIVMRADDDSVCVTREGPQNVSMFGYPDGAAFFDARPNPPGWVPFTAPEIDLPFYTWMRVADPTSPNYCDFRIPTGDPDNPTVPNTWILNDMPICGCAVDPVLARNRCWFVTPDLVLWRDMPLPWESPKRKVRWTVLPNSPDLSGLVASEAQVNNELVVEPAVFKELKGDKPQSVDVRYQGIAEKTVIRIQYQGSSGAVDMTFDALLDVPKQ